MSSKKAEQLFTARSGKQYTNDELVGVDEAIRLMGYAGKGSGAFGAACKTHPYLGLAIVDRVGVYIRRVALEAVERYVAEVKTGGGRSRDGLKAVEFRLSDAETAEVAAWASAQFGREVVGTTAAQRAKAARAAETAKAESNGVEAELEADDAEYVES